MHHKNPLTDHPYFQLGLFFKLLFVMLCVPQVQAEWFVPFLREGITHISLDPWTDFLAAKGDARAFPYGVVMYLFHLPFVAAGLWIDQHITSPLSFTQIGFSVSLLVADIGLLMVLQRIVPKHTRELLLYYWLSPIVFYITYWHGQTDIIPVLLIALTLLLVRQKQITLAGVVLGLSVAAKLSAVLLVPFMLLFLWKNKRYALHFWGFVLGLVAVLVVMQGVVFLLSPGMQQMILHTPEMQKIYDVAIPLGEGRVIYLVPVLYLLLLYLAWRIGRMDSALLHAFLGAAFFIILLFTPASVGWFLWVVPFLVLYQLQASRSGKLVTVAFSLLFVLYHLWVSPGASLALWKWQTALPLTAHLPLPAMQLSIILSVLVATGLVVAISMLRLAMEKNDFYQLSRAPLAIGIAGDSGTGKDTLSAAIAALFGEHAAVSVSGDDYHLFERKDSLWDVMTHLDPKANDLHRFTNDSIALLEGQNISCRHYDHKQGVFTRHNHVRARDVVLVSGLHALYNSALRERLALRVFLDMDEGLRRFFKLRRDVHLRGHAPEKVLEAMERRIPDYNAYIAPQAEEADVIFSLYPLVPEQLTAYGTTRDIALKLQVTMDSSFPYDRLRRLLVALAGIKVMVEHVEASHKVVLDIEAQEIGAADIAAVAEEMVPHFEEVLALSPAWQGGMTGIMQLILLVTLEARMRRVKWQ